jgi:hypothetical protein
VARASCWRCLVGRFEVHNTRQLGCGRVLEQFPTIIGRLAGMVDRFTTTLYCVDTTFIGDGLFDQLPTPAQLGATRVRLPAQGCVQSGGCR